MSKLEIQKLTIHHEEHTLVDITLSIDSSTALIGQSGSGKSLTLKSILNLLPSNLHCNMKINCDFELNKKKYRFYSSKPLYLTFSSYKN